MRTATAQSKSTHSHTYGILSGATKFNDNKMKSVSQKTRKSNSETEIHQLVRKRRLLISQANQKMGSYEAEIAHEPEVARLNDEIQAVEVNLAMTQPSCPQDAALQLQVSLEGICEDVLAKINDQPTAEDLSGDFDRTYRHIIRQIITYLNSPSLNSKNSAFPKDIIAPIPKNSDVDPVIALAEANRIAEEALSKTMEDDSELRNRAAFKIAEKKYLAAFHEFMLTPAISLEGLLLQARHMNEDKPELFGFTSLIAGIEYLIAISGQISVPQSKNETDPVVLLAIEWRSVMKERDDKYSNIAEELPAEKALYEREYDLLNQILKGQPLSVEGVVCQVEALKKHFDGTWDSNADLIIKPIENNAKRFQKASGPASPDYEHLEKALEDIIEVRTQNRIEEALYAQHDRWIALSRNAQN